MERRFEPPVLPHNGGIAGKAYNRDCLEWFADSGFRIRGTTKTIISFTEGDVTFIAPSTHYVGDRIENIRLEVMFFQEFNVTKNTHMSMNAPRSSNFDPIDYSIMYNLTPSERTYIIFPIGTQKDFLKSEFERFGSRYSIEKMFKMNNESYKKLNSNYQGLMLGMKKLSEENRK